MDRGTFGTGLDSTRASAALGSQSSPGVTRQFEDRMRQGMALSFQAIHTYHSPFLASSRILDSGGSGRGFVTADGATPSSPSILSAIDLPRTAAARPAEARTADAQLPAADLPSADELEFQDFTAALLTMRQSSARLRASDFGGDQQIG
jgi:hypothetical protein